MRLLFLFVIIVLSANACIIPIPVTTKSSPKPAKSSSYREVDLEEMIRRYIAKTKHEGSSIEGIYSVSAIVTKKSKSLLAQEERERTTERRDNYAKVAILKDWPGSNTEYVEISLSERNSSKFPIVAEITSLREGRGFLYKHFEPNGKSMTFIFTHDQDKDILDGAYSEVKGKSTITYKLSYLKTYPKKD